MGGLHGRMDARTVYLIDVGCYSLFTTMIYTVIAVYYVTVAHFNPLQLVLIGTVLEISEALFELPTGVLADAYNRRLLIVLGTFLIGANYVVQGTVPLWRAILAAEVVRGAGDASVNGALEAWIAGEVGGVNIGRLFLQAARVRQIAAFVGIPASVGLASIRVNLPVVMGGGFCVILAVFLALTMPEHRVYRSPRHRPWGAMSHTLGDAIRVVAHQPIFALLLGVAAFRGMSSEGIDRLWEAHFLTNLTLPLLARFKPVVWFGIIELGSLVLGILATHIALRRLHIGRSAVTAWLLAILGVVQVLAGVAFALAWNFPLAVAAFWMSSLARRLAGPIFGTWLVQAIDARVRATVLSMVSQIDALGQMAGGPIAGAIATIVSLRMGLVTSSLLLVPTLAIYVRIARQMKLERHGGVQR